MRTPFWRRANTPDARALRSTSPHGSVETKSSPPLVALELSRCARFTTPEFSSLCREGFAKNPIVYRCVRLIAENAASVPLGDWLADVLPLDQLERFYGYLQVAGEAYLEAVDFDENIIEIRALRPDYVKSLTDRAGRPAGFELLRGEARQIVRRDPLTGRCNLFAHRLFNPLDDQAQSPLQAAATSVDLHNQGTRWAKSLLDNSARPSGALIYSGQAGSQLTPDQIERLKSELEAGFTGPARAGRPMVLEGGLDWKTMGLSPSDMDFAQGRREAARDIALAFGVPPMLLGIPGDNTYSNYAEANRAFWRQTIVPLVNKTAHLLSAWLEAWPDEEGERRVRPDYDRVPALSDERAALWTRLGSASFLTESERRDLAGLPPLSAELTP